MAANDVEFARRDGAEFRPSSFNSRRTEACGHTHDMGPQFPRRTGEQNEFWVTVPPHEVGKPAFLLMKERFAGRLQAVTEFRDFCKGNEVLNEFKTSP
jgi:hypothetical protein